MDRYLHAFVQTHRRCSPRASPNVSHRVCGWGTVMSQHRNQHHHAGMGSPVPGGQGIQEISVRPPQFCYEPKTVLKN